MCSGATSRVILGTVQLGMPYGIANTSGQPNQEEANAIIEAAYTGGISFFDTAQGYGKSEEVLGKALVSNALTDNVQVITKLSPQLPETAEVLQQSLVDSSMRLGISSFYCVMLHREEQLSLLSGIIGQSLQEEQRRGILKHIGISVYSPEKALEALQHPLISVVQIPTSIFDRRFEHAGVFTLADKLNKEIHIRSVFLQGVVLMHADALPSYLAELSTYVKKLRVVAKKYAVSPACLALGFVQARYAQAKILFGAEAAWQVNENINYARQASTLSSSVWDECVSLLPPQKAEFLNPALWKR